MVTLNIMSYKYGHLAAQAIESALCQTTPFDVINFYDDGVGDCKHLNLIYPEVNFIHREKRLGIVANFQDALMNTETERVMFLGADNWLHPNTLETLLKEKADIVSYDIKITGEDGKNFAQSVGAENQNGYYVWKFKKGDINKANYIHGSSLYDTEKAKQIGYSHSGRKHTEEDHMLFKGMINAGATYAHVLVPFLYYRRHRENFNQPD